MLNEGSTGRRGEANIRQDNFKIRRDGGALIYGFESQSVGGKKERDMNDETGILGREEVSLGERAA